MTLYLTEAEAVWRRYGRWQRTYMRMTLSQQHRWQHEVLWSRKVHGETRFDVSVPVRA